MKSLIIDPSTGRTLREIPYSDWATTELDIKNSFEAYAHWRQVSLETRLNCVKVFEERLKARKQELAHQISKEMGKIQSEAVGEINKCITSCAQLRELFPKWKAEKEYTVDEFSIHYEGLGPVLGIMPWNYPVWQVVRFAIPALLNGNTILLKHAPSTWGVAEMLTEVFAEAFPYSVFLNLFIDVDQVPRLIADSRLRGVSLTGSRTAGAKVGALAGEHLKKCVLELGGSDAYLILDDADIELAADVCTRGRLINAGQSCVAAKRFIVTRKNVKVFTEALVSRFQKIKWGPTAGDQVEIGPMARKDLRDALHAQVMKSVSQGAKRLVGAELPAYEGFYYPASVLADVRPGQVAFDEELFGPVASIIEAKDEKEAIALANSSRYGLGGAVFSKDLERAKYIALKELDSGMVFVNDYVRSDARIPFGGIKDSGLGRELGREGSFEFCNIKTLKL